MTGNEYADLIASYLVKNFSARGVTVYREVSLGKTIIGKNRHVDIFVLHAQSDHALAIECKYQDSSGTVDEKIPYAIQDMQAMGMSVCLAYAGSGFSDGILHMLAGCPIAAACLAPAATLSGRGDTATPGAQRLPDDRVLTGHVSDRGDSARGSSHRLAPGGIKWDRIDAPARRAWCALEQRVGDVAGFQHSGAEWRHAGRRSFGRRRILPPASRDDAAEHDPVLATTSHPLKLPPSVDRRLPI